MTEKTLKKCFVRKYASFQSKMPPTTLYIFFCFSSLHFHLPGLRVPHGLPVPVRGRPVRLSRRDLFVQLNGDWRCRGRIRRRQHDRRGPAGRVAGPQAPQDKAKKPEVVLQSKQAAVVSQGNISGNTVIFFPLSLN